MKTKLLAIFLILAMISSANAFGQKKAIKRGATTKAKTEQTQKTAKTASKSSLTPQEMMHGWYYVCVMQSWNLSNAQTVCKRLAKLGYKAQIMDLGYDDYYECESYTICIKQTYNLSEAQDFIRSFKNPTEYTDYVYYGQDFIGGYEDLLKMKK